MRYAFLALAAALLVAFIANAYLLLAINALLRQDTP